MITFLVAQILFVQINFAESLLQRFAPCPGLGPLTQFYHLPLGSEDFLQPGCGFIPVDGGGRLGRGVQLSDCVETQFHPYSREAAKSSGC